MEYMYTKVKGEYDTMGFIDEIKAKAKADLKTIVLPESMDKRTFEAAEKILKEGIARLVIIGTPEEIEKNGKGFDLSLSIRSTIRTSRSISTSSSSSVQRRASRRRARRSRWRRIICTMPA